MDHNLNPTFVFSNCTILNTKFCTLLNRVIYFDVTGLAKVLKLNMISARLLSIKENKLRTR